MIAVFALQAEAASSDAAQEASFEAEEKWEEKVEQLQVTQRLMLPDSRAPAGIYHRSNIARTAVTGTLWRPYLSLLAALDASLTLFASDTLC